MDIKEVASKGGTSTYKKYGAEYMKEISRRGVEARKKKKENSLLTTDQSV